MNRIFGHAAIACQSTASAAFRIIGGARDDRERGDVPGWVMITLMSAVLVMGLLAIASPTLEGLFKQAISKVSK
ncbi:hypothetical protein SPF06_14965 [Sinomonas sp. JGH33]|uniref:Uncharacterized protein n=1 Tax=Sinomonas terricola TaxID=3110330 RepID=A0ABU5T927_9MICC|nr:hypothetical protein [Sinomonas sp. JGH33]MEA5456035.1 hypothetical protein [Sinomonas sp. JGH33]